MLFAFPIACDTAYLSNETGSPASWLVQAAAAADAHPGDRVAVGWRAGALVVGMPSDEAGDSYAWSIRNGKLAGFSSYRWTLEGRGDWEGITILAAPPNPGAAGWRWFVMIRAERLWRGTLAGLSVHAVALTLAADLGSDPAPHVRPLAAWSGPMSAPIPLSAWKVARIDICRDHGGDHAWTIADLGRFASRSPQWARGISQSATTEEPEAWQSSTDEGWTYGNRDGTTLYKGRRRRESRFLRIYCKSAEAVKTGKIAWLAPYWRQLLLDGAEGPLPRIWRAEVEFGGGWLSDHGFATADCLAGCERALWTYYVESVRHVDADGASRLKRCGTSTVWALLSENCQPPDGAWKYEPKPEGGTGDASQLIKQAAGCIAAVVRQRAPADVDALHRALAEVVGPVFDRALHRAHGYYETAPAPAPLLTAHAPARADRLAAAPIPAEDAFSDPVDFTGGFIP